MIVEFVFAIKRNATYNNKNAEIHFGIFMNSFLIIRGQHSIYLKAAEITSDDPLKQTEEQRICSFGKTT